MKKLILIMIIGASFWHFYQRENVQVLTNADLELMDTPYFNLEQTPPTSKLTSSYREGYTCDGRQYCSQMRSCSEANFFLQNCPDTKMDGNSDGIPCERQHCKQ